MRNKKLFFSILSAATITAVAVGAVTFGSAASVIAENETCKHSGTLYSENKATSTHIGNKGYFVCCSCHEAMELVGGEAPTGCTVERTISTSEGYDGDINENFVYTYIALSKEGGEGGTSAVDNALKKVALPSIDVPYWDMHTFLGYFDAKTGGKQYYSNVGESLLNNDLADSATLYAQWSVDKRDVKITVAGGTTDFKTLEDNSGEVTLPVVTAEDCYGEPLTPVRTYKFNGETATDPGYNTTSKWAKGDYAPGTHQWTFTATDTHEITGVVQVAEVVIKLEVCPILLNNAKGGSYKISQTVDVNPNIYLVCEQSASGMEPRPFNVPASKQYYAEITVNKAQQASGIGLIHSRATTVNDGFVKEYLQTDNLSTVDIMKAGDWMNGKWAHTMWDGVANKFNRGLDLSGTFDADNWITKDVTLAIARNGNVFYFMIDGTIFESYSSSDFNGADSLPGIYFQNCKVGTNGQIAKNVKLLNGSDAVAKIQSIEAVSNKFGYFRNDNSKYSTCSENNGVLTYKSVADQQYYNCIVGSKKIMKGTNHIHFRYECTEYNVGGDDLMKFSLSFMDVNFTTDPNAKAAHLASWSIIHYNSYNTTIKERITTAPVESGYDYTKACGGDGSTYHWDVAVWDVDIYVKSYTLVGVEAQYTISYTLKEVAYHSGTAVTDPATYNSGDLTAYIKGEYSNDPKAEKTSFYALTFQGHKASTFVISNLLIEAI